MKNPTLVAGLLLAFSFAASAQTAPATRQVTEVTEDLDPATGKVIRRTTRTYTAPATSLEDDGAAEDSAPATSTPAAARTSAPAARPAAGTTAARTSAPAKTTTRTTSTPSPASTIASDGRATDAQVTDFFREKTTVSKLSSSSLVDAYGRFTDKVREDRRGWNATDWARASAVLSSLNARYEQLRPNLGLEDKLSIRSHQAEYQALRTARQLTDQVSDKL